MPHFINRIRHKVKSRKKTGENIYHGDIQQPAPEFQTSKFSQKISQVKAPPVRPANPVCAKSKITCPHAIVIADFTPLHDDELPAKELELVALLKRSDALWYYACTWDKKNVGYIPRNFLKIVIDIPSDFSAQNAGKDAIIPTIQVENVESDFADIRPASEFKPRRPRTTPRRVPMISKLHDPEDLFFKVIESYTPQMHVDIGVTANEIVLCLDERVVHGEPIPETWIYCSNLSGRTGVLPGNILQIIDSQSEIVELLTAAPHAIANKTVTFPLDGFVEISEGEVLYIERLYGNAVYGRTASGQVGRLDLNDCVIIVPP